MPNKNDDVIEIDLLRLFRALWRRVWLILFATVLAGSVALAGTVLLITPQYQASVLMYVNSSNISVGGAKLSISQSDLVAAKSLIDTYTVILNTRTTLNDVIEEAELSCTYPELVEKLEAEAVNGTEVFRITVTDTSPSQATLIANTIAQVLPEKIASIVEGSSARIVDMAVQPVKPSSPSYVKNTAIGAVAGLLIACCIVAIQEMMDDKIHNSDYLIQTYDLPVLAAIPDLLATHNKAQDYYYRSPEADRGGKR